MNFKNLKLNKLNNKVIKLKKKILEVMMIYYH